MKQIAVILGFPYLAPTIALLAVVHLWPLAIEAPQSTATFFGGQVSAYYIIAPIILIIQILIGIPGSLVIKRSASRRTAIPCCAVMSGLPFAFLTTSGGPEQFTLWSLLPIIGIAGLFGLGSCVSYYFLYHQRQKKPNKSLETTG